MADRERSFDAAARAAVNPPVPALVIVNLEDIREIVQARIDAATRGRDEAAREGDERAKVLHTGGINLGLGILTDLEDLDPGVRRARDDAEQTRYNAFSGATGGEGG